MPATNAKSNVVVALLAAACVGPAGVGIGFEAKYGASPSAGDRKAKAAPRLRGVLHESSWSRANSVTAGMLAVAGAATAVALLCVGRWENVACAAVVRTPSAGWRSAAGAPRFCRVVANAGIGSCDVADEGPVPLRFALKTVAGRPSAPLSPAAVKERGVRPLGLSVEAVSTTGLKGRGSVNQDSVGVLCVGSGKSGNPSTWVGVVADGHGKFGHFCASRVSAILPELLEEALAARGGGGAAIVGAAFRHAFAAAEADLEETARREKFDIECSGCAVGAVVLCPEAGVAHMASCGDCQAVLFGVGAEAGTFKATVPHKAHDRVERARIEAAGGYVRTENFRGETFSRVYTPNRTFGLAMSRSLGDMAVKRHGVVAVPTVETVPLPALRGDCSDVCCVLGSDGLFDFIKPLEIVKVLNKQLGIHGAAGCAHALVVGAQRRWQAIMGDYVDDVSCLLMTTAGCR